ncbi:ABC transporter permease [Luteococcus sp. OSA5]|uniref:ABC transporter permease n=1 Tax=Luteococcus sp. OSA5 TaxID=3401630 RepID=UPI003B43C833
MSAFLALLGKEFREIVSTWRLWVLPGFLLFNALTGPLSARLNKQLMASVLGPEAARALPEPTFWDSWAQWTKNLSPTVLLVILVTMAGLVCGEVAQGTAVLVLTKPVSRTAFVLAKFVANLVFITVATAISTAVTWALTAALFDGVQAAPLWRATALWLVAAACYLTVALLLSSALPSTLGAAGASLGVLIVVSLLGLWGPLARNSVVGLPGIASQAGAGEAVHALWPVATSVLVSAVLLALAVRSLTRREI